MDYKKEKENDHGRDVDNVRDHVKDARVDDQVRDVIVVKRE